MELIEEKQEPKYTKFSDIKLHSFFIECIRGDLCIKVSESLDMSNTNGYCFHKNNEILPGIWFNSDKLIAVEITDMKVKYKVI